MNSHPTDRTSLSLLDQLRQDDHSGWRRLVDLYGPLIYGWARRCGLSDTDSADVMQEVFAAVSQRLPSFQRQRDGDSFRAWLRTITRNKICDHARRQSQQTLARGGQSDQQLGQIPDSVIEQVMETAADAEKQQLYQRVLCLLRTDFEERTWKAFMETAVHGRTSQAAALDLGMTPGAVRQAKYKVLRRLRAEFGELVELP